MMSDREDFQVSQAGMILWLSGYCKCDCIWINWV